MDCSCQERSETLIPVRRRRKSVSQHPATPDKQRSEWVKCFYITFVALKTGPWPERTYLGLFEFVKIWCNIEEDPIERTRKADATTEQNEEHKVRVRGREVYHLWGHKDLFENACLCNKVCWWKVPQDQLSCSRQAGWAENGGDNCVVPLCCEGWKSKIK